VRDLDHRIPLQGNRYEVGSFASNVAMRSMAALLAHERQRKHLENPTTFLATMRPPHPLDAIMMN
jgi:hypothetical protein